MYDGDGIESLDQYDADLKFEYIYVLKEVLAAACGTVPAFLLFFLFHALGRSYKRPLTFDIAFLLLALLMAFLVISPYARKVSGLSIRSSVRAVHVRQTWSVSPNLASRSLLLATITLCTDLFFNGAQRPELVGQTPATSFILASALALAACAAHVALAVALLSPTTTRAEPTAHRHAKYHTVAWLGPTLSCGAGWMVGDILRPLLLAVLTPTPHLLQPVVSVLCIGFVLCAHIFVVLPLLVKCATVASSSLPAERASVVHEVLSVIAQVCAASVGWLSFHCVLEFAAARGVGGGGRSLWGLLVAAVVVFSLPDVVLRVRRRCAERRLRAEGSVASVYFNALVEIYTEPCVRSVTSLVCAGAAVAALATAKDLEGHPEFYVRTLVWSVAPLAVMVCGVCLFGRWVSRKAGYGAVDDGETAMLLDTPLDGYESVI